MAQRARTNRRNRRRISPFPGLPPAQVMVIGATRESGTVVNIQFDRPIYIVRPSGVHLGNAAGIDAFRVTDETWGVEFSADITGETALTFDSDQPSVLPLEQSNAVIPDFSVPE